MKTLDEVIEDMELTCSVNRDYNAEYSDALHYLQEYRAEKASIDILRGNYEDAIKNCEKAENKFIAALKRLDVGTLNNPLTWDELKAMEGKPVWVEGLRKNLWGLVDGNYINAFGAEMLTVKILHDLIHFDKREQGKTWQAYRKER